MPRFWNKYPYTDFHELNADYVFDWIKQAQDFIDEFTAQVNQNTADIVSLKTRMTTAEGDISGLKTRMTTAEGKIATIENTLISDGAAIDALEAAVDRIDDCALMNSTQIEAVANPQSTATKVTLQFESERYESGAAAAGGMVDLDLPQATQQNAGTMNAEDKQKVDQLAISGDIEMHDAALEVVADMGLLVDEVDDANALAVPNLGYLASDRGIKTVEIFNGAMTPQASPAIYASTFPATSNGKLLYMQRGGQKAFYFDATAAEINAIMQDTDDMIIVTIPEACRQSKRYSWTRRCIDENDGLYGEFDIRFVNDSLTVRYLGTPDVPANTPIEIKGWYLPFM